MPHQGRELTLSPPTLADLAAAMVEAIGGGWSEVSLVGGDDELAAALATIAREAGADPIRTSTVPIDPSSWTGPILHVLLDTDGSTLSDKLLRYLDVDQAHLVAPVTDHAASERSVFAISPPKAGTHLLFGLLGALGFKMGYDPPERPLGGRWYYLEYTNAHTNARDFFVDSVRRGVFGNRLHPFPRCASVMIYRHPLDIVTSESRYDHVDGKTPFSGYLAGLSPEQRLLRLLDDPWLLGSLRDRLAGFVAWLDFPSVIPVSFEELVGPRGGGRADEQCDVVWSLQLKLHAPGRPEVLCESLFDPSSPTFSQGTIGGFEDAFTEACWTRFRRLPRDFMDAFGYDESAGLPRRRHEFRRRPLGLSRITHDDVVAVVTSDYMGHFIVRQHDDYLAVPRGHGFDETERVLRARTLDELQVLVARRHLRF